MKRSGFKSRSKPMSRGIWSRKSSPLPESVRPVRKASIKSRMKKPTVAEGAKYLAACRGEPCYLNVEGVCCWDWETVVPAHSNQSIHGKGLGIKAAHRYTVPACFTCHAWLDTGSAPRWLKEATFNVALAAWEPVRARKMGITQPEMEIV
ncbi:nuclease domain-containing protein [Burkholderia ubonensis]|uniref:nuclease domain-containing protein n=1 Tax=Burkholderia ubonensis TaxID=101571 RepID=UPI0009B40FB4|nr:nuclease domain-containing protein [Burkholderia ubonensis]